MALHHIYKIDEKRVGDHGLHSISSGIVWANKKTAASQPYSAATDIEGQSLISFREAISPPTGSSSMAETTLRYCPRENGALNLKGRTMALASIRCIGNYYKVCVNQNLPVAAATTDYRITDPPRCHHSIERQVGRMHSVMGTAPLLFYVDRW